MKKIVSLFMVILLLTVALCGCGGTEAKDEKPSDVGSVGGEASSDTDDERWPELADLMSFASAYRTVGNPVSSASYWKTEIDGATVQKEVFDSWMLLTISFKDGNAPALLGIDVCASYVEMEIYGIDAESDVGSINVYYPSDLSADQIAKLTEETEIYSESIQGMEGGFEYDDETGLYYIHIER